VIPEVEQNHLSCGLARVILAEGTSALVVEALTLQVLFAELLNNKNNINK